MSVKSITEIIKHGHLDTFAEGIINFVQNKENTVFSKVSTAKQFEELVSLACAQAYNSNTKVISENGHSLLTAAIYCVRHLKYQYYQLDRLKDKDKEELVKILRNSFEQLKETIETFEGNDLVDKNGNSILLNAISFANRDYDQREVFLVDDKGVLKERTVTFPTDVAGVGFALDTMLSEDFLIKHKSALIQGKDVNGNNILHHLLSHKSSVEAISQDVAKRIYDANNVMQFQGESVSKMTRFLRSLNDEELKALASQKNDDGFTPLGMLFSSIIYEKINYKEDHLLPLFDKETFEVIDRAQRLTGETHFEVFKKEHVVTDNIEKIYGNESKNISLKELKSETYSYNDLICFAQLNIQMGQGNRIILDRDTDKIDAIVKETIKNGDEIPPYLENKIMSENVKARVDIGKLPSM